MRCIYDTKMIQNYEIINFDYQTKLTHLKVLFFQYHDIFQSFLIMFRRHCNSVTRKRLVKGY